MRKITILILFFSLISILSFSAVSATNYTVSGSNFDSIQSTVNGASSGDNISLGNKIYTSGTNKNITISTNNLIIKGQSPTSKAKLNGQGSGSIILLVRSNNVRLENLVFENVDAKGFGGAIQISGVNVTIINCEFVNNKAMVGAIQLSDTANNALIQNCNFERNGAIYRNNDNTGGSGGGAIDSHASNGRIINCNFTNNYANIGGGALYFILDTSNTGTGNTISGCNFNNNTAPNGGAIWLQRGTLTISNSQFTNNQATNNGGAIYSTDVVTISNSNFMGNSANYGSAIQSNNNLYLSGNKFSNNKAKTSITLSLPYGITYNLISVITDKIYNPTIVKVVLTKNDNIDDAIWQTDSGNTYINNVKQNKNNYLSGQNVIINGKYSGKTDENGVALIKFNENTLTSFNGLEKTSSSYSYNFFASYGGNNLYNGASNSLSASAKISDNKVDSYWNLMTKKVTSTKTITTYAINKTGWYKKSITLTKVSKPSSSGTWQKYNTKTKKWESSKAYSKTTSATKVSYKNVKSNTVYVINKTGWYKKSSWIKVSKPSSSGTWQKYNTKTKTWSLSSAYINAASATKVSYKNTITSSSSVSNGLEPYVKADLTISTTVGKTTSKYAQKGVFVSSTKDIYFKDDLTDNERKKYKNALINHVENKKWVHVNDPDVKKHLVTLFKDYKFSAINGKITSLSKARAIYNWVVEKEKYSGYPNSKHSDLWSIAKIKALKGKGSLINCADHSNLLVSLLRTAGIPAVYAHVKYKSQYSDGHYWACAYVKFTAKKGTVKGKTVTAWHWLDAIHSKFKYNKSKIFQGWKTQPKLAIDGIVMANKTMVNTNDLSNHNKYKF